MRRMFRLVAIVAIGMVLVCTVVVGIASPTTGPIEKAVLCGLGVLLILLARRLYRGRAAGLGAPTV
jgi:hypothetical protein